MDESSHLRILTATSRLRDLLAACSTPSVAGWVMSYELRRANSDVLPGDLFSPARQCSFLLGQLLSTPEPVGSRSFAQADWDACVELLNEIFLSYNELYFKSAADAGVPEDRWRTVGQVAMGAFLHYFNSGLLASTDQLEQRVRTYLVPFDTEIRAGFGVSVSEALDVVGHIGASAQDSLDKVVTAKHRIDEVRTEVLGRTRPGESTVEQIRAEAARCGGLEAARVLLDGLNSVGIVSFDWLASEFPERVASAFWKLFTIGRGDVHDLQYITEHNPVDDRPLILRSAHLALCPRFDALHRAVLQVFESYLAGSPDRDRYFRRRDDLLETDTAKQVCRLFGKTYRVFQNVYETSDGRFEHDIVALGEERCVVVECKASPPVEPFRDPQRAFTRIKHHFAGDRGIQKSYDQGVRVWRRWKNGESVTLHDAAGDAVAYITRDTIKDLILVCVTRDNYGPLATDLSLLLEKDSDAPSPWALNAVDLESIADAWTYFGWDSSQLWAYLSDRIRLHGRIATDDELDIVGYFIRHGTLNSLLIGDKVLSGLDPSYSGVFDEIYRATCQDGPPVVFDPKPPVMMDLRSSLQRGEPVFVNRGSVSGRKVGRNEPCPCGSGRKFKRCCGS